MIMAVGKKMVFGIQPLKPIVGAPEGKQRLKMRNRSAVILFVRNSDGIRQFLLEDREDSWCPTIEIGMNHRPA